MLCILIWGRYMPTLMKKNIAYKPGSYGHLNTRVKEIPQDTTLDILFLGSSHAYRSFDPRIFAQNGIRIFNLGSSAQTPLQTNVLLNRYLKSLRPKLVVYEVYTYPFAGDGTESALDLISNSPVDFSSIKMAFQINQLKVYNTLLYASMGGNNASFTEPIKKDDDTYISGGFVQKNDTQFKQLQITLPQFNQLKQQQLNAFEKNLELIKAAHIPIALVYAPITQTLYKSNKQLRTQAYLKSKAAYYNFNELFPLPDSCFFDSQHLNQQGAEQFNLKLIALLKQEGLLK